jgi:hypothetical protein
MNNPLPYPPLVPTLVEKGEGQSPPFEVVDVFGGPDNGVLFDDCWIFAVFNGGGG